MYSKVTIVNNTSWPICNLLSSHKKGNNVKVKKCKKMVVLINLNKVSNIYLCNKISCYKNKIFKSCIKNLKIYLALLG
jgi:hypothetical protein